VTSEFDTMGWALQEIQKVLGEHPREQRMVSELGNLISEIHTFGHELGRMNINIRPKEFQTDHFLSHMPFARRSLDHLEKLLRAK